MNSAQGKSAGVVGLVGALVTVVVWLLSLYHIVVPGEVTEAFGTIFSMGLVYWAHSESKPSIKDESKQAGFATFKTPLILGAIGAGLLILSSCSTWQAAATGLYSAGKADIKNVDDDNLAVTRDNLCHQPYDSLIRNAGAMPGLVGAVTGLCGNASSTVGTSLLAPAK